MNIENTLFVGKVCHAFDQLPSTNDYAKQLIANSTPSDGTLILTANQTAGRGQFGRQWQSTSGASFTGSFIFRPVFLPAANLASLSHAMALGIAAAIRAYTDQGDISIKWPNDIYIDHQKVAGVLIETTISASGTLATAVVGIGVNLLTSAYDQESVPGATCIELHSVQKPELHAFTQTLCVEIEQHYVLLKSGGHAKLLELFNQYLYGKSGFFAFEDLKNDIEIKGYIGRVLPSGLLVITQADGRELQFEPGTIRMIRQ